MKIKVLTQRSVLVLFLAANAFNPLLALPLKSHPVVKRNQQVSSIFQKINNILQEKGLDSDAALQKVTALLEADAKTLDRLHYLYESPELFISKEQLVEELANYALFEKKLDLNSYDSLIGLAQSVLSRPLVQKEFNYLQQIPSMA